MLADTDRMPSTACDKLLEISRVVALCSSTDEAMVCCTVATSAVSDALRGDVCESRKDAVEGLKHSIARLPKEHPLRKTLEATLAHLTQDKGKVTYDAEKMGMGE